jgi:hypothetical protein
MLVIYKYSYVKVNIWKITSKEIIKLSYYLPP